MQSFDVEIHSVESQQVVQVVKFPIVNGSATITRVPQGSTLCLEPMAQKLLTVPFGVGQEALPKRKDEEIQISRRLAMISSRIYIASKSTLSCVITMPWFLEADSLLDSNRVKDALALADQASGAMEDVNFEAESLVPHSRLIC